MLAKKEQMCGMIEPSHEGGGFVVDDNKPGVKVGPNFILFGNTTMQWACLCRIMRRVDAESIEDEHERALFVAHREALYCAVLASLSMGWLDERLLQNVIRDITEYL